MYTPLAATTTMYSVTFLAGNCGLKLEGPYGGPLSVVGVRSNSQARVAGVETGDVVVSLDDEIDPTLAEIIAAVSTRNVTIVFARNS